MEKDQNHVPEWQQFEIAVASFIQALDSSAKVTHDARTPDGDTGYPRQRDVWIEGRFCSLFPIRVLVRIENLMNWILITFWESCQLRVLTKELSIHLMGSMNWQ